MIYSILLSLFQAASGDLIEETTGEHQVASPRPPNGAHPVPIGNAAMIQRAQGSLSGCVACCRMIKDERLGIDTALEIYAYLSSCSDSIRAWFASKSVWA